MVQFLVHTIHAILVEQLFRTVIGLLHAKGDNTKGRWAGLVGTTMPCSCLLTVPGADGAVPACCRKGAIDGCAPPARTIFLRSGREGYGEFAWNRVIFWAWDVISC